MIMLLSLTTCEERIDWSHPADPVITLITCDSRRVIPGALFMALPGNGQHGADYIPDAIARGAAAIITDRTPSSVTHTEVPIGRISQEDARAMYARLCARFFGPVPDHLMAVTGTNGKTSVTFIAAQMLASLYGGHQVLSIGTLGARGAMTRAGSLTTPDPADLHALLAQAARNGVRYGVMEASSHGLDQDRLVAIRFDAAAFTHLTHDHLDYHGTMDAYWAAKKRLFRDYLAADGVMVVNDNTPQAAELLALARARGTRVITYGSANSDIAVMPAAENPAHASMMRLTIRVFGHTTSPVDSPFLGDFQRSNIAAALGLVLAHAQDRASALDRIITDLPSYAPVPGRMQPIQGHPKGARVFVDYAHTPDALEKALATLRPLTGGRLIVVFGCGGNRDAGKRAAMGAIADRLADEVVITDDNPRTDDPALIRSMIHAHAPRARIIADRAEAIHHAIRQAGPTDTVLIAGKGHETGQIYGTITRPFDDAQVAHDAITILASDVNTKQTERGIR